MTDKLINEDREYERREAEYDARERRRPRGCWCGLDGYSGSCPGAANCPYSGFYDDEQEPSND